MKGASKQISDPKNSTAPGPRPPGFEIPGSATDSYTILLLLQPLVQLLLMIVIYYSVFLCAMHIELLKVMNDLTFAQRLKSCVEAAEELLTKYMPMVESLR